MGDEATKGCGFSNAFEAGQFWQILDEFVLALLTINHWQHFSHFAQMVEFTTFVPWVPSDFVRLFLKCVFDKWRKMPVRLIISWSQRRQLNDSCWLIDLKCSLTFFLMYLLYFLHISLCRPMEKSLYSCIQNSHWTFMFQFWISRKQLTSKEFASLALRLARRRDWDDKKGRKCAVGFVISGELAACALPTTANSGILWHNILLFNDRKSL